jgi:hypothetical protein
MGPAPDASATGGRTGGGLGSGGSMQPGSGGAGAGSFDAGLDGRVDVGRDGGQAGDADAKLVDATPRLDATTDLDGASSADAAIEDGPTLQDDAADAAQPSASPDGDGNDTSMPIDTSPGLLGAPLIVAPTANEFGLSVVMAAGDPGALRVRVRTEGAAAWGAPRTPTVLGADLAEWQITGLSASTRYDYQVSLLVGADDVDGGLDTGGLDAGDVDGGADGGGPGLGELPLYQGSAVTQRPAGQSFTFAIITDSHIGANLDFTNQGDPATLEAVSAEVATASPDFLFNLGDMLDFHEYGFNGPPPSGAVTRQAYLNYRMLLGDTLGQAAHFPVVGNWDGENGDFTADEVAWSQEQRMLYVPAPGPTTYPESGSPREDYYAFTWGDDLFVVLNVMSYTKTSHLLGADPGLPDDWTLGDEQLAWFESTLAHATSKWRFVLIHHAVGGAAGDPANSAYGRGGGQAAYVGEQAKIHQLMQQYGVQIFFYGHDHVFTDMKVDGIHYTLPGSSGAIWMFSPSETGYAQQWQKSGWARVTVAPSTVHVELIALGGELLYDYTLPE